MPFVMFDVYTAHALGLNDTDAEALAAELQRSGQPGLAGRIRYGVENETPVEIDPTERRTLAESLDALLQADPAQEEQVSALASNLRARIVGSDILPPPDGLAA